VFSWRWKPGQESLQRSESQGFIQFRASDHYLRPRATMPITTIISIIPGYVNHWLSNDRQGNGTGGTTALCICLPGHSWDNICYDRIQSQSSWVWCNQVYIYWTASQPRSAAEEGMDINIQSNNSKRSQCRYHWAIRMSQSSPGPLI